MLSQLLVCARESTKGQMLQWEKKQVHDSQRHSRALVTVRHLIVQVSRGVSHGCYSRNTLRLIQEIFKTCVFV